jgi:hypothetical protein
VIGDPSFGCSSQFCPTRSAPCLNEHQESYFSGSRSQEIPFKASYRDTVTGNGSGTQFDGAVSLTLAGNAQIFVSSSLASDQTTFKGTVTIKAATPNAILTKSSQAIFVKAPKLTNVTVV